MSMPLREQLAGARDSRERAAVRSDLVRLSLLDGWNPRGQHGIERGNRLYLFEKPPGLVRNRAAEVVGVDVYVRVLEGGRLLKVDPHRVVVNPPLTHEGAEDPYGAWLAELVDQVAQHPNRRGFRTRGTVTTVYGDANDGSGAAASTVYASARAFSPPTTFGLVGIGTIQAGQNRISSTRYCYECLTRFDTSTIPDDDTVTAATLSCYGHTDNSTTDFTVEARLRTYTDNPIDSTSAGWIAGGSLSGVQLLASFATSGFTTSGYCDFTSDAAFPANVNKTDFTCINLSSSRMRNNNDPTNSEYVLFYAAAESGTSKDPKLVVTHQVVTSMPPVWRPSRFWKARRAA